MCCYFLFADFIESDVSTRSLTWLDFSFAQKTQFRIVIFKSFDTNIEYCKLCCQQHPSRLKLFEIHRIVKTFKSQNKIRLLSSLPPSLLVVIRKSLPRTGCPYSLLKIMIVIFRDIRESFLFDRK